MRCLSDGDVVTGAQAKVFCEIATVHPKDIQHIIQA